MNYLVILRNNFGQSVFTFKSKKARNAFILKLKWGRFEFITARETKT